MVNTSGRSSSAIAACLDRRLVVSPGLPALGQHSLDHPAIGLHAQGCHRAPVRQREHVGRLERHVEGVSEVLGDLDAGDHRGDLGPDVHRAQREVAPVGA
jgi:hypothetical protein